MQVMSTRCDNPTCAAIDVPECAEPYIPPYGWLYIKDGYFVGTGPTIQLEVCSAECLPKAIEAAVRREAEGVVGHG